MKINQRASGSSLNVNSTGVGSVAIGGNMTGTVINDGEVWINGEKCYPSGLIEELDSAYSMLVTAAAIVAGGSGGAEWGEHYQQACKRVEKARRALDL